MKNKFPQLALVFITLLIGLVSCEKDDKFCVKCFSYNDRDFGLIENCVGYEFIETEEDLNQLATRIENEGYKITLKEKCK